MKRTPFHPLALIAALLWSACGASGAAATSVLPLELAEMVAGAQHIAHVRCIGNEAQPDATVGLVTVTTFVVLDRVKGAAGATFTVRQAGGELNGMAVDYRAPKFRPGDEYVLFMPAASKLGLASPVGLAQGAFGVRFEGGGKAVGNGRDVGELLAGVDRAAVPAGVASLLAQAPEARRSMDLADFMTLVRASAGIR